MTSTNETFNSEIKPETRKTHLLNDRSFKILLQLQKEVAQKMGWMPSLSTLVNALVNTENLILLKENILAEFETNKKTNIENTEYTNESL